MNKHVGMKCAKEIGREKGTERKKASYIPLKCIKALHPEYIYNATQ